MKFRIMSLYKGEGRILIAPSIQHIGGYYMSTEWFIRLEDNADGPAIGQAVKTAIEYVINSQESRATPKERDGYIDWKKDSKYKSKVSFCNHNHHVLIQDEEDGYYTIYSQKKPRMYRGEYEGEIKKIVIPKTAHETEIGQAVLEVFEAAELYYQEHKYSSEPKEKTIDLLNASKLTFTIPKDKCMVDCGDGSAAEIYQCYSYEPKEGEEAAGELFLAIASELDCDLREENITSVWQRVFGKAEDLTIQEVQMGIYTRKVEMKNKDIHKISYLLQMEEDLILECSMNVYNPNRRKKTDEKLTQMLEAMAKSCKF